MSFSGKILFTDIDGTLLQSDQTISDETARLLDALATAGHSFVLASGRPLGSILKVYSYLTSRMTASFSKAFIIANNGAQIYDCLLDRTIYETRLPIELVDTLQDIAEEMRVHLQTYTDEKIVCTRDDDETRSYTSRIILPVILSDRLADALDKPPYKMLAMSLKGSDYLMPFRRRVSDEFSDSIHCIFSGPGYLEIIPKEADKGNALRFVTEHLQLPIQNTYAAGDSENDLSMLLAAHNGYAMINADEQVRSACRLVTSRTNNEGGIDEILKAMLDITS
ncbi:MAG: HAD family hydrolase [Lachnospiraceae bacterium]|nr:HAD family hydrolase [Lachnospiraceae bacterium]